MVQLDNMLCYSLIILLLSHMYYTLNGTSQDISSDLQDNCVESISYRMKYGIFNVGKGTISYFTDPEGNVGQIKAEAQSIGWIKIFKDLNYRYESNMDLHTGLPNIAINITKQDSIIIQERTQPLYSARCQDNMWYKKTYLIFLLGFIISEIISSMKVR